ncbi:MAG: primosomal protein N', partial [Cupriavidus sp.]|nr:primosomal protein N' [Cupriavidus sp.]
MLPDSGALPAEPAAQSSGAAMSTASMSVIRVALDTPADDCFDYLAIPNVAPGDLVVVPFGRRSMVGVAVEFAPDSAVPADKLRPVAQRLDWVPPLQPDWIGLAAFAARYYQRRLGEVMLPALPPALREAESWPSLSQRARTDEYRVLPGHAETLLAAVPPRARSVRALAQALADRAATGEPLSLAQARVLCAAAPSRLAEWQAAGWVE